MNRQRRWFAALVSSTMLASILWWPSAAIAVVPTAVADSFTVQKNDAAIALDVLANDTHDPLTSGIASATDPPHGTVVLDGDGQGLTYDPDQAYTGSDSFIYTIHDSAHGDSLATVTIKVNAPPVAIDDPGTACMPPNLFGGAFPIVEDHGPFVFFGVSCGPFQNDTDPDGSIVNWEPVGQPLHGALSYMDPNVAAYTPDPDYSTLAGDQPGGQWVSDSFTYRVVDDDGAWSQPATMRIWISPINDPPTFLSVPDIEVAEDSGVYDQSWAPYVSAGPLNESNQTVTFHITSGESHGVVNLFSVPPTFTANGHLTFTPGPNEHGYALITGYLQDDGGLENYGFNNLAVPPDDTGESVTFTITVDSVHDAAVARDDALTLPEDSGATTVLVRDNDSIGDDAVDILRVTGTTNGLKGTAAIAGGGAAVAYTPNANANGADSFTYTVSDGTTADTGTVQVTITPVNDPPTAASDAKTVAEDAPSTAIAVLANDTIAPDTGETLTISATSAAGNGSVAITGGGTGLTYRPNANFYGNDTFTYTIFDGNGGGDTSTVNVAVTPVNDPPTAVNDGVPAPIRIGTGAGPMVISVLVNDRSSPDGPENLRISAVTQASHGAVAIIDRGARLTYDPVGTTSGIDVFSYTISDGHGGTDTATVQVQVTTDATAPVIGALFVSAARLARPNTVRLVVSWTAADPESGIAWTLLQMRRDGGAWNTVTVSFTTATRRILLVAPLHSYQFRVRVTNGGGLSSPFRASVNLPV